MAGVTRIREIDLNADLGEGYDDAAILPYLSSCSIACGAHAGDAATMRATLVAAMRGGVACGAHPGYPDREGFGRRELPLTLAEIADTVLEQIGMLSRIAREEEIPLGHVKPHGALYHVCHRRRDAARAVCEAVARRYPRLAVVGMPGSILLDEAERAGLRIVAEGFADRLYLEDGTLAPRGSAGAVHASPQRAAEQALGIARYQTVVTATGAVLPVPVRTICIHGDSPGAPEIARAVREKFASAGVDVRPFGARSPEGTGGAGPDAGRTP